jgi:hypothetical protein
MEYNTSKEFNLSIMSEGILELQSFVNDDLSNFFEFSSLLKEHFLHLLSLFRRDLGWHLLLLLWLLHLRLGLGWSGAHFT